MDLDAEVQIKSNEMVIVGMPKALEGDVIEVEDVKKTDSKSVARLP